MDLIRRWQGVMVKMMELGDRLINLVLSLIRCVFLEILFNFFIYIIYLFQKDFIRFIGVFKIGRMCYVSVNYFNYY